MVGFGGQVRGEAGDDALTTNVNIERRETVIRTTAGALTNVSIVPRSTTITLSNEKGPQGPQGPTGNTGLTPMFSRQGNLYAMEGRGRLYVERSGTVSNIRASVGTAPVGSAVVVDVLKNGSEVAILTIAAGSYTTVYTTPIAVSSGDYFTVNISSVGSTTPGADLTVAVTID